MRVSIITEGVSEFASLPLLWPQLEERTGHVFVKAQKVNVPPDAAPAVVARECKTRVLAARRAMRAELVVVILDREEQDECAGVIADRIHEAIGRSCGGGSDVVVVLKDRCYENWLLSDLDSLRAQSGRFTVSASLERQVEPNRADNAPAMMLVKQAVRGDYDKVRDSARIVGRMNVAKAAGNSRSFRHFLHVLGDCDYTDQCRRPA